MRMMTMHMTETVILCYNQHEVNMELLKTMTVAFIGSGAMGSAMARGVRGTRTFKADVVLSAAHYENAVSVAKRLRCRAAQSNTEAVQGADVVFIAVKPAVVESVIREIDSSVKDGAVLVSAAAGVSVERLTQYTGRSIARIMPNVGASAGQSMTALCCAGNVSDEQKERLLLVLKCFGEVAEVEEKLMPVVTAVSGSGPAYVFMFIEAMADAAVRGGMKRADAYTFAAQTVLGAGALAMKDKRCPAALKDAVCSPAGTTIEGVAALEAGGFRAAVMAAVEAALKKA